MTLWPLMRPISGNVTLLTPVLILLGKLTYHIDIVGVELAQKTKEFNILRKSTVFMKYEIMAPNTPHIRECDATYPCSHFTCDTKLSYRHIQFN